MGQRHLPRPGADPAADQRRQRGRVVRVAKWPLAQELAVLQKAGDRMDHRDREHLLEVERRQQAGQPARHHRLAGAGRADHQQVVAAGGRHLQRPLGALLPLDVLEVAHRGRGVVDPGLRRAEHLGPLEVVDQLQQRARRQHLDRLAVLRRRPGRLGSAGGRDDDAPAFRRGVDRRRQHPRDRRDRAVQRQFPQRDEPRHLVRRQHAQDDQEAQRDRQVVVAAFLCHVRRSQVDDQALERQRQAQRMQRGAHPLLALAHRLVGQADQGEGHLPAGDGDLHVDRPDRDALERHRVDSRDQFAILLKIRRFEREGMRNGRGRQETCPPIGAVPAKIGSSTAGARSAASVRCPSRSWIAAARRPG